MSETILNCKALSLSARASPLRVLGFLRRSALRRWSQSVSRPYKDSYDSSARPMGVASLNSTLPCAIATFPVSLPLSSPGDVWPRLPLLPSTRPWTSAHPPWPPQPKPQPLTPLVSNPPLCQSPGCRSVHSRFTLSPSHPVLSALRPQGFSTRVWFSSLIIPDVSMVFDYGKQVYTTVVLLLLCCRRALLLLSAPVILMMKQLPSDTPQMM